MTRARIRVTAPCVLIALAATLAHAQVFCSEFVTDPISEGWELINQYCDPELWNVDGWYHQQLDLDACPPGPQGGHDSYRRSLESFNGATRFFLEFRLETDGDRSEIPGGAPTVVAMGNFAGINYNLTIARDQVKFLRDVELPIWFIEIQSSIPHTYRIELDNVRYALYIDAYLTDEGIPEGPYPSFRSVISWRGKSWYLPCHNAWDYIRYGITPKDASGDYDSDAAVTHGDFYFFHECLTNDRIGIKGGPETSAGPGCRFADFDADSDVDLLDFAEFTNQLTAPVP